MIPQPAKPISPFVTITVATERCVAVPKNAIPSSNATTTVPSARMLQVTERTKANRLRSRSVRALRPEVWNMENVLSFVLNVGQLKGLHHQVGAAVVAFDAPLLEIEELFHGGRPARREQLQLLARAFLCAHLLFSVASCPFTQQRRFQLGYKQELDRH